MTSLLGCGTLTEVLACPHSFSYGGSPLMEKERRGDVKHLLHNWGRAWRVVICPSLGIGQVNLRHFALVTAWCGMEGQDCVHVCWKDLLLNLPQRIFFLSVMMGTLFPTPKVWKWINPHGFDLWPLHGKALNTMLSTLCTFSWEPTLVSSPKDLWVIGYCC